MASATTSVTTRKSELILPNSTGTGINRLPDQLFYITANTWRKSGVSGDFGNTTLLFPDSFITIRHRASVTRATVFRSLGEVELKNFTIPLFTNASGKRDNYVALFRPVPVKLSDLNLIQSGAFVASATTSLTTRRDELLTFDNLEQRINKIPSAVFYYTGGNWRKQGSSDFQNDTLINTGEGFTIRKYQDNVAPVGETAFWINTANY